MSDDVNAARTVLAPDGWVAPRGYVNGVVADGRLVVLAGQIGWNPCTLQFESDDFAAQVKQALANILTLLHEESVGPAQLVRLTWYITDRGGYMAARRQIGQHWRELFGPAYPPMSVVIVSGLIEPRALVEIEATAVIAR
jgi:enamine deaminase RidA (YjgF/YER057c/UK114 family)